MSLRSRFFTPPGVVGCPADAPRRGLDKRGIGASAGRRRTRSGPPPAPNPNAVAGPRRHASLRLLEPKKTGPWTRLKARIAAVRDTLTGAATKAKESVSAKYKVASDTVNAVSTAAGEVFPLRRTLWVGLGAGVAAGLVCLLVPHAAAAAVSAVSVTATTVAVQTGSWLKRAARRFGLVS